MPKIIQHDIGQAVITGVPLRQHCPVITSHSLSFSAGRAFLSVVDIGLLTIEQTLVHSSQDIDLPTYEQVLVHAGQDRDY